MPTDSTMEETPSDSTLYPKITNHIKEVLKRLQWKLRDPSKPETEVKLSPIPIVGTVKLHGTHADILVHNNNSIVLQSRNRTKLVVAEDNQGFAASMAPKRTSILRLRDQYFTRWEELNPGQKLDKGIPVTIAGEWIGEKIQKGVAISHLSKRFVIISVKINGSWICDSDYKNIEAPEDDIYNISRGGIYHMVLYPNDQLYADDYQRSIAELSALAEKVAANCPFAESFSVHGEGEGLVWKPIPYVSDPDLWFKTKGGKFKPTFTPQPKKSAEGTSEKREFALQLAISWCSELRLEQGWDYLKEMGIERNMNGIGSYLKWVQNDILAEENGYIKDNNVDEQTLRIEIIKIAKPWFLEKYQKG